MQFATDFDPAYTPQSQPLPGTTQVPNRAGGFAWAVDHWPRLDRFLVLGTEGGTYYVSEQTLTLANAVVILDCLAEDGARVVERIVAISTAGRAPKNDPALFALAICVGLGDEPTRQAALTALPKVARIGTHLFHFLAYARLIRGWGRGLRRAVADWYNNLPVDQLAYQAIKYQQRNGWSHRDALRLAHPRTTDAQRNAIYHWITQGWPSVDDTPHPDSALRQIWAFEQAKQAQAEATIVRLIQEHALPWEAIPTQWLGSATVWRTLLPTLPMTALLRNLARMTANGTVAPATPPALGALLEHWGARQGVDNRGRAAQADAAGPALKLVIDRLTDVERLRNARIHPIAVLAALHTYSSGRGARGSLIWEPQPAIVAALDKAFYLTFGNVAATGKRIVLALDVSGSMDDGTMAGVPGLTPRVAATAMALVTAATEPQHTIIAFSAATHGTGGMWGGGDTGITRLTIAAPQRLDDLLRTVRAIPMGGTDCALPMRWALQQGVLADAFVVYTDNETWHGAIHPAQALQEYRRQTGIAAKLIVVAMTADGFTIADPTDGGMLDVVGFDTATPQLIADFIAA